MFIPDLIISIRSEDPWSPWLPIRTVNMPRSMAPPPSGEFSIRLTKSFGHTPTEKIEIIGQPNRPANIKITKHVGKDNQTVATKEGSIRSDDVNELLSLVRPLEGLPTNPNEDIYGFDTRIILSTFEVQ